MLLRAERSGNGRVYHIHFTPSDLEGSSSGVVTVSVRHSKKRVVIDRFDFQKKIEGRVADLQKLPNVNSKNWLLVRSHGRGRRSIV